MIFKILLLIVLFLIAAALIQIRDAIVALRNDYKSQSNLHYTPLVAISSLIPGAIRDLTSAIKKVR